MAIICPNFNDPDVAREFNELKNAIGEKAAYAVWSLNNGNSIEKTPDGAPSLLFQDLLTVHGGDRISAIKAKASLYGNEYLSNNNWLENNSSQEPQIGDALLYLSEENTYGDIVENEAIDYMRNEEHISSYLHELFLDSIDTSNMTQDQIDQEERKFYSELYKKSINRFIHILGRNLGFKITNGPYGIHANGSKHGGSVRKTIKSAIKGGIGGAIFGTVVGTPLALVGVAPFAPIVLAAGAIGATTVALFDKTKFSYDMRKLFVETMYERLCDPHYSGYAIKILNDLYHDNEITPDINIRYVAEIYVDSFWNDSLVLAAVKKAKESYPDATTSLIKKEIADQIVNQIDGHSIFSDVADSVFQAIARFRKSGLKSVVFKNVCKHLATAMSSHDYLSNIKKDAIFKNIRKYGDVSVLGMDKAKDLILALILLNKARLNVATNNSTENIDDNEIKKRTDHIKRLEAVDTDNVNDVNTALLSFLNSAYNELASVIDWLDTHLDTKSDDFDKSEFNAILLNVIRGYLFVANHYIHAYVNADNADQYIKAEFDELLEALNEAKYKFDKLENEYCENWIREIVKIVLRGKYDNLTIEHNGIQKPIIQIIQDNAVLSLHNRIRKTGIAKLAISKIRVLAEIEKSMRYANLDESLVINTIDRIIRETDLKVTSKVVKKRGRLLSLFERSKKGIPDRFFLNPFKHYIERADGGYTANFKSPINVGQYESELHEMQKDFFNNELTNIIDDLNLIKENIELAKSGHASVSVNKAIARIQLLDGCPIDLVQYIDNNDFGASFDKNEYRFTSENDFICRIWKNRMDMFDGGYDPVTEQQGPVRKHKRYDWKYYVLRRSILSIDTELEYTQLSDRMSAIKDKYYNEEFDFYDYTEITAEDKRTLKELEFQMELISNPYDIQLDQNGNVISAIEKTGDAARMSLELRAWLEIRQSHVFNINDDEKFNAVSEYLKQKYGLDSPQYKSFLNENIHRQADKSVHDLLPLNMPSELQQLYKKRNYILKYAKLNQQAYEDPNLNLLSPSVIVQLHKIDNDIQFWMLLHPGWSNGSINEEEFADELLEYNSKTWKEDAVNPDTGVPYLDEIWSKYGSAIQPYLFYIDAYGNKAPLSIFSVRRYADSEIFDEYSSQFLKYDGDWVDLDWKLNDDHMNIDKDLYRDESYFKEIEDHPERKAFYDELIATMDEIWELLPKHKRHYRYQMPQIVQEVFRNRLTQSRPTGSRSNIGISVNGFIDSITGQDENDDMFAQLFTTTTDGTVVQSIPIRYVKPLKTESWAVDTDIIKTVSMMYEMALLFKYRKQIEPDVLLIQNMLNGGVESLNNTESNEPAKRLSKYVLAKMYGNNRRGFMFNGTTKLTGLERLGWILARNVESATAKAFLNWNFTSWGKNALDSFYAFTNWVAAGNKVGWRNIANGLITMLKDLPNAIGNIGTNKTSSWVSAAMQFHKLHESTEYSSSNSHRWWIRDFFNRFLKLGPFTLIDYTFKGAILSAIYDSYKYDTQSGKFLTKEDFIRMYAGVDGIDKDAAISMYNSSNITLKDAYSVNKDGVFTLNDEFKDAVRPIDIKDFDVKLQDKITIFENEARRKFNEPDYVYDPQSDNIADKYVKNKLNRWIDDHRDSTLETELSGVIDETASYINGMFTKYKETGMNTNIVGSMIFLMRGWFSTQFNNHFKDGADAIPHEMKNGMYEPVNIGPTNIHDKDFLGKVNLATGAIERGDFVENMEAGIGKLIFNRSMKGRVDLAKALLNYLVRLSKASIFLLCGNKKIYNNELTEHEKFLIRSSLAVASILLGLIFVSKYTALAVETQDEQYKNELTVSNYAKDWAANFIYSTQVGVQGELMSKFGRFGLGIAMADILVSPMVTTGYIEDVLYKTGGGVFAAIDYASDWMFGTDFYKLNGYDKTVTKFCSYRGLTEGLASMLATFGRAPGLINYNIDNAYKGISIDALKVKQWYGMNTSALPLLDKIYDGKYNIQPFHLYRPGKKQTGVIPKLMTGGTVLPQVSDDANNNKLKGRSGSRGRGRSSRSRSRRR